MTEGGWTAQRVPNLGVVVPCRNYGRFLPACLESIRGQTYTNWDLLVIDDASDEPLTLATLDEVEKAGARVIRLPRHRGVSGVRNLGAAEYAKVPLLVFVDADDLMAADYFALLVEVMGSDPSLGGAHGTQIFVEADGVTQTGRLWPEEGLRKSSLSESVAPGSGTVYRTAALASTSGWRRSFSGLFEDWELALQLLDAGWNLRWVEKAHYFYRRHGEAILANWNDHKAALFRSRLLRHHRPRIESEIGVRAYLDRYVIPTLTSQLRSGRLGSAGRIGIDSAGGAPRELVAGLVSYYWRRLRDRVRM